MRVERQLKGNTKQLNQSAFIYSLLFTLDKSISNTQNPLISVYRLKQHGVETFLPDRKTLVNLKQQAVAL